MILKSHQQELDINQDYVICPKDKKSKLKVITLDNWHNPFDNTRLTYKNLCEIRIRNKQFNYPTDETTPIICKTAILYEKITFWFISVKVPTHYIKLYTLESIEIESY